MTDNTDKLRVENETLRNENCDLSMRLECAETELEDVLDRLNDEKRSRTRLKEEINALRREVGELKEKNETLRRELSERCRSIVPEESRADEAGDLRKAAKDLTNDMQFRMINALNDCRAELISALREWQVSLFRHEYGRLAAVFVNLAGISSSLGKRVLEADAPEEMRAVSAKLGRIRERFAGALEDAGLRVIEPEPGERFDPALHSAPDTNGADADEDGGNLRILTVESPGVLLVTGNGEPPEVLIEASVTVGRINEHGQNG